MICLEFAHQWYAFAGSSLYIFSLIWRFNQAKKARKVKTKWGVYFRRNTIDFLFIIFCGQILTMGQDGVFTALIDWHGDPGLWDIYVDLEGVISGTIGIFGSLLFAELLNLGNRQIRRRLRSIPTE